MRQAGRYLQEYNATRRKAGSFLALAKTPELACEVTLQPLDRFALDAAILFSDIMTPLEGLGLGLRFTPGPVIDRPGLVSSQRLLATCNGILKQTKSKNCAL